jgi:hypothetical protein
MTPIRVVVPWSPGCDGYRIRNWAWLRQRWPWPTIRGLGGLPWVKARAVMPAVADAPQGSIVVVADADVWCNPCGAIYAVANGAPWAVPHALVHRLTDAATYKFTHGERLPLECEEEPYVGYEGGGVIVARREMLLDVPLDPRFVGWGAEDDCWGIALRHLAGDPWRGGEDLVHLWHPPQQRTSRTRGSAESSQLRLRYYRARQDPAQMRALIEEAKAALSTAQPDRHDHAEAAV